MKKILVTLLMIFGCFSLVACDEDAPQPEEPPVIEELTDVTLNVGAAAVVEYGAVFKVLAGVTAVGNNNVSYATSRYITVTASPTLTITNGLLDTKVPGTYTLTYTLVAGNVTKTATRSITVNEKVVVEGNMLSNPYFDADYTGWEKFQDGSSVSWETETIGDNSYAKIVETSVSGNSYSPRLHNVGENYVTLITGQTYEVSFQAKASEAKKILCQVGQLLPGDPYFYDFGGQTYPFDLTTEMKTFSFQFTLTSPNASADLTKASVTFEMGTVEGDSTAATIWLGDVLFEEFEGEVADTVAPAITANDKIYFVGNNDTINVADLVAVVDAVDGEVTPTITIADADGEAVTTISNSVAGVYTVTVAAVDAAGNEATKTFTISVLAKTGVTDLFTGLEYKEGVNDEATSKENPLNLCVWYVGDLSWNCGPICNSVVTAADGVFTLANTQPEDANTWGVQAFFVSAMAEETGAYKFSMKINASVAGAITLKVCGVEKIVELVSGDNTVEFEIESLAAGSRVEVVVVFGKTVDGVNTVYGNGTVAFSEISTVKNTASAE